MDIDFNNRVEAAKPNGMVQLWCAVLGGGLVVQVKVEWTARVRDLAGAVASQLAPRPSSSRLELYLARRQPGRWLLAQDRDVRTLAIHGRCFDSLVELLTEDTRMDRAATLGECFVAADMANPSRSEIHVLVVVNGIGDHLVGRQSLSVESEPRWKWELERMPVYSLDEERLFFVGREAAVSHLIQIHSSNFDKAVNGSARAWAIPLADNVSGMGKTEFATTYIQKCREIWASTELPSAFARTLCACRTVRIVFAEGDLLADSLDEVVVDKLVWKLDRMFLDPPKILVDPPSDSVDLLTALTAEVGPLFLVLDEIGVAFQGDARMSELERRDAFIAFCQTTILRWLPLPSVFFLLVGHASFLSHVSNRVRLADCRVCRLELPLLRADEIKQILQRTPVEDVATSATVAMALGMDDAQTMVAAEQLCRATCGHPKSVVRALNRCHSIPQLLSYASFEAIQWSALYDAVTTHRADARRLVKVVTGEQSVAIDLTGVTEDGMTTRATRATTCWFQWSGSISQARLFASPFRVEFLMTFVLSLDELMRAVDKLPVTPAARLEWLVLKRFQELFRSPTRPRSALSMMFAVCPTFWDCPDVAFSARTQPLPTIADPVGDRQSLQAIDYEWTACGVSKLSLKSRPHSWPCDVLVTTLPDGVVLTVGIVIHNHRTSVSILETEIVAFDGVFGCCWSSWGVERRNVLLVFATNMDGLTNAKPSTVLRVPSACTHVDEVVLINWSTPLLRAQFFGRETSAAKDALERTVGAAKREKAFVLQQAQSTGN